MRFAFSFKADFELATTNTDLCADNLRRYSLVISTQPHLKSAYW